MHSKDIIFSVTIESSEVWGEHTKLTFNIIKYQEIDKTKIEVLYNDKNIGFVYMKNKYIDSALIAPFESIIEFLKEK